MEKDSTRYLFLVSRNFPLVKTDTEYETTADGKEIARRDGQEIVALDVTTSFSHAWEADLSKYPVSSGSEISDHLTVRNNKYTLKGVVSETPFEAHSQEYLGSLGTGYKRVVAAIDVLREIFDKRLPFTLFTEHKKIENVVMTKVNFDQASQFATEFQIEFEQVRFAYARTVALNVKKSAKKSVASNKNGGGAAKQDADSLDNYRKKRAAAKELNQTVNNG